MAPKTCVHFSWIFLSLLFLITVNHCQLSCTSNQGSPCSGGDISSSTSVNCTSDSQVAACTGIQTWTSSALSLTYTCTSQTRTHGLACDGLHLKINTGEATTLTINCTGTQSCRNTIFEINNAASSLILTCGTNAEGPCQNVTVRSDGNVKVRCFTQGVHPVPTCEAVTIENTGPLGNTKELELDCAGRYSCGNATLGRSFVINHPTPSISRILCRNPISGQPTCSGDFMVTQQTQLDCSRGASHDDQTVCDGMSVNGPVSTTCTADGKFSPVCTNLALATTSAGLQELNITCQAASGTSTPVRACSGNITLTNTFGDTAFTCTGADRICENTRFTMTASSSGSNTGNCPSQLNCDFVTQACQVGLCPCIGLCGSRTVESRPPTSNPTGNPTTAPVQPSASPSVSPTVVPSLVPTYTPTSLPVPSAVPTFVPSQIPSGIPTNAPSSLPSQVPTTSPSSVPSSSPSTSPSTNPSSSPSSSPSATPSAAPTTSAPTNQPSQAPSSHPITSTPSSHPVTSDPSRTPSQPPTAYPTTSMPTSNPTKNPSRGPSKSPSRTPTDVPTIAPTVLPSTAPSDVPSDVPSYSPSSFPSLTPTITPTDSPSTVPSAVPSTSAPSSEPTNNPTRNSTKNPVTTSPLVATPTSAPSMVPSTAPTSLLLILKRYMFLIITAGGSSLDVDKIDQGASPNKTSELGKHLSNTTEEAIRDRNVVATIQAKFQNKSNPFSTTRRRLISSQIAFTYEMSYANKSNSNATEVQVRNATENEQTRIAKNMRIVFERLFNVSNINLTVTAEVRVIAPEVRSGSQQASISAGVRVAIILSVLGGITLIVICTLWYFKQKEPTPTIQGTQMGVR